MARTELVFGLHAVEVLLARHPERILEIFVLGGREDAPLRALLKAARAEGIAVQSRERRQLDELAGGGVHQGVIAKAREQAPLDEHDLEQLLDGLSEPPFLLVLDGITDPHNLGACLRTAEAAGVQAVITTRDKSAGLTPVARKVAAGAAELLPFVQVTNLARTLRALQERGVWLIGTALEEGAKSLYDYDLRGALAIVMGAEGSGLRRLTKEHCDGLAYVPMVGSTQSLNVSVATGVALFEALRQRRG